MPRNIMKLEQLSKIQGYRDSRAWIWDNAVKTTVMGICTARECDYIIEVDSDEDKAWCEVCLRHTVKSGHKLAI